MQMKIRHAHGEDFIEIASDDETLVNTAIAGFYELRRIRAEAEVLLRARNEDIARGMRVSAALKELRTLAPQLLRSSARLR